MNYLPWTIYLSFLGAALILCCPGFGATLHRVIALTTAIGTLAIAVFAGTGYHPAPGQETVDLVHLPWVPAMGVSYHLSADGISLTLVLLTALASVAGVLFSWNISERTRGFFSLYLLLIGGVFGVFLSRDAFLFFVFYEIAIIPKYFLIAIWGSTNRRYGAMKLALYSFVGSAMVLVGLLVAAVAAHVKTGAALSFDVEALSHAGLDASTQHWLFPLVFVGFAILAGMWPFHTWAPTGHVAAPTAASMLLAGVVMKLGAYGCLRVAMPLFPAGLHDWQTFFAVLAAVGIVWGALAALVQTDFKFVIGYSSVSHMGFVLLGLLALNREGLTGGVLQMFSHGVVAGLLFAVVGRMVYDRTHTRDLTALGKLGLFRAMPFAAVVFVLAGLASMGLPGFSGFVAELSVLMGAWNAFPAITLVAVAGIPLAAAYTLRAFNCTFFAEVPADAPVPDHPFDPVTWPEIAGVLLLLSATIYAGLCPGTLIRWIHAGLDSTLMHGLTGGLS
jgi:NADH-quinone oxidoreductase subunit M